LGFDTRLGHIMWMAHPQVKVTFEVKHVTDSTDMNVGYTA